MIPSEVWASYRRDIERALGDRGARWAAYNRKEILLGKTHVHLLEGNESSPVGFALFPKVYPVGLQLEMLYLMPGHRTATALRTCLEGFIGGGRLFSVSGLLIGVSRRTQRQVFPGLGFRFIERQNLWIDPLKVLRRDRALPSTLRPLRKSDETKLLRVQLGAYKDHIDTAFGPGADASVYGPDYVRYLFSRGAGIDFGASFVSEDRGKIVGDILVMGEKDHRYIHELSRTWTTESGLRREIR